MLWLQVDLSLVWSLCITVPSEASDRSISMIPREKELPMYSFTANISIAQRHHNSNSGP